VDGPDLRLGFAAQPGGINDLRVQGDSAREILRWLRLNADFLTKQGSFAPNTPTRHATREYHRADGGSSRIDRSPSLGRTVELAGHY